MLLGLKCRIQNLKFTLHQGLLNIVVPVYIQSFVHRLSLLTAEDFCFLCDLYLQFIAPMNLWNKCIELRLFLKCKVGPVLRPLRSKDDSC